jgi:hypothetical protein
MIPPQNSRTLSRGEAHDLSVLIGVRTKVLKAYAAEQASSCMADFEAKLAAIYSFDQDTVWKAAMEKVQQVAAQSQAEVARECEKLGIPAQFAPGITVGWYGRGENGVASRRVELRRVAASKIDAMKKAAITKIEKDGLSLRTQVVTMGLLSDSAKVFLESLAPIEESMHDLDFAAVEQALEAERQHRLD